MAKKPVTQEHHIIYDEKPGQEVTANVYKGEHLCLTRINWYTRNKISKGFIKSLKVFIALNEDRAEEIKDGNED